MRRLRIWTTAWVIFGVFLVFGFPLLLTVRPPKTAPLRDREVFAVTLTAYFGLIVIVLAAVMWMSWKLYRAQVEELTERRMENLKDLIEGTLNDHASKKDES
jgi:hypothetical protein